MTNELAGMCVSCLAQTEGACCPGVASGEQCLSGDGPVYAGESDNDLSALVASLYAIRAQKRELDKTEKELLAELKPLVDPQFDVLPKTPVEAGGLVLTRIAGTSRSISADLLLERGVAAEIVSYATKTTEFFQYRVREAKSEE